MLPSNESVTWHPLASPGSGRRSFPCFVGTMRCSDVRLFLPPRLVAFAGRYHPLRLCSFLRIGPTPAEGQELSGVAAPRHCFEEWKQPDLPGSWGILVCLCPVLRPRQDRLARPYNGIGAAPALTTTKAPATKHRSGLKSPAWALAGYASQPGLPQRHARLASRCWPLCGAGLATGRIPIKGFELRLTSHPPFPSFSWRNVRAVSAVAPLTPGFPLHGRAWFVFRFGVTSCGTRRPSDFHRYSRRPRKRSRLRDTHAKRLRHTRWTGDPGRPYTTRAPVAAASG